MLKKKQKQQPSLHWTDVWLVHAQSHISDEYAQEKRKVLDFPVAYFTFNYYHPQTKFGAR